MGFVVPDFTNQIVNLESGENIIVGNLKAKRDFLDVSDVVKAYVLIIKKGKKREIYNISSAKSYKIEEILKRIIKISTKDIKIKIDKNKMRPSDIKNNCLNNSKITRLGWKTTFTLDNTLKKVYLYFEKGK